MQDAAWAFQRPGKKSADLKNEQWWQQELRDAGYDPDTLQHRESGVAKQALLPTYTTCQFQLNQPIGRNHQQIQTQPITFTKR